MGFIVIQHNDDQEALIDAKSYLSVYSVPDFSLIQSHILPTFNRRGKFVGSHCKGLYLYTNLDDIFVLIDLITKVFKPLSPPKLEPNLKAEFHNCGIGQDPNSGDYKIVAAYHLSELGAQGHYEYLGFKNRAHVYSLGTDLWTEVPCPDFTGNFDSVYVGHVCYWTAFTGRPAPSPPADGFDFARDEVVSFDFSTNEFDMFPLPQYQAGKVNYKYDLIVHGERLGAIGFSKYEGPTDFDIWVYKEKWTLAHTFSYGCVEKALALTHDRFLFLAVLSEDDVKRMARILDIKRREVHMVDLLGDMPNKNLKIYGQRFKLRALPFDDENQYPLPGGQPLIESYSDDDIGKKEKKKEKKKKKKKKNKKKQKH